MIDTNFNFHTDSNGKDPDSHSPTLKKYHKLLWSKKLPSGIVFKLENKKQGYLVHSSELGEFILGSDSITHSYRNQKSKKNITSQIPDQVNELWSLGSTIGAFIIFPNNRINYQFTINQARGCNSLIDDRFDLTLECIRLFYENSSNPLFETLNRYNKFFYLFENFYEYVNYFFLQDLIDYDGKIKFYLPFDNFETKPLINSIDEYMTYKKGVEMFIKKRNKRIEDFSKNFCESK